MPRAGGQDHVCRVSPAFVAARDGHMSRMCAKSASKQQGGEESVDIARPSPRAHACACGATLAANASQTQVHRGDASTRPAPAVVTADISGEGAGEEPRLLLSAKLMRSSWHQETLSIPAARVSLSVSGGGTCNKSTDTIIKKQARTKDGGTNSPAWPSARFA